MARKNKATISADDITIEVASQTQTTNETNEVSDMNLLAQQAQQAQQAQAQAAHTLVDEQAAYARAQAIQANEQAAQAARGQAQAAHEQAQWAVSQAQAAFDAGLEQAHELQQQAAASSTEAATSSGGSMFAFSHESGGMSGTWLGAAVATAASGMTSFLSSSEVGVKDIAAAGVAAVGGFAAGYVADKYIEGSMLRPATAISAGAAIGVGTSKLTNMYFGTVVSADEVPAESHGDIEAA